MLLEKNPKMQNISRQKIGDSGKAVYGVNTGFGSLCKVKISDNDLEQLQYNLIRSHACGTGPIIPDTICRILLLLKIQSLSYGNSGVSVETVWRLIDFLISIFYLLFMNKVR